LLAWIRDSWRRMLKEERSMPAELQSSAVVLQG